MEVLVQQNHFITWSNRTSCILIPKPLHHRLNPGDLLIRRGNAISRQTQLPCLGSLLSTGRQHRCVHISCGTPEWRLSQPPGEGTPASAQEPLQGSQPRTVPDLIASADEAQSVGIGGRIKRFFLGDRFDKERIKALGEALQLWILSHLGSLGLRCDAYTVHARCTSGVNSQDQIVLVG